MKHSYIQRYIYAVTKRLPSSMREDVKAELEANIQDMIAEDPDNETLLLDKLHKLGHPRVLANNYRGKDQYVVSPEYYDDYINTLKIVGTIFIIVSLATGFIQTVTMTSGLSIPDVFQNVLNGIFDNLWQACLSAFAWTTIGFWIASTVSQKNKNQDWKLSDLPDLPESTTTQISRIGTIFELIIGVSFGLIFVTLMRNGLPFFNQTVIEPFIPFFYISIALDLLVGMMKLFYGQWRWPVILVTAVEHLYSIIFSIVFLSSDFLHSSVFQTIADHSDYSLTQVQNGFATGKTVLIWLVVIGSAADLISIIVKVIKSSKKE
jgi:hypothetical protein